MKVAILHQAVPPPVIDGVIKPAKPGGYRDSGSDIAYCLKTSHVEVITPVDDPKAENETHWTFPDTEEGINHAIQRGATCLWANTVLFSQHPLYTLRKQLPSSLRIVGNHPVDVEKFDDKAATNEMLGQHSLNVPQSQIWSESDIERIDSVKFPTVIKPIRGRGSYGVEVCHNPQQMERSLKKLFGESDKVMLEQFMSGEECTITVMPPGSYPHNGDQVSHESFWTLPPVTRFGHHDGVAPYNGVVAVANNSRAVTLEEYNADPAYAEVCRQCAEAAKLVRARTVIRIDVRRTSTEPGSHFILFDLNMKPNMTGPGRPGREEQASLVGIAASGLDWNYSQLLTSILKQAWPLSDIQVE